MISSTCFGYSDLEVSKFCFKVPARRNGDCTSPNQGGMNLKVSTCNESLSLIQWNRSASQSASQICTSKKACLMSPPKATGLRASFVEVAQSLRNRSMKGTLCCFSYNCFVRQITFSFPLSLIAHSLHNIFFQLVLD